MDNIFEELLAEVKDAIRDFHNSKELYDAQLRTMGRTGRLTAL